MGMSPRDPYGDVLWFPIHVHCRLSGCTQRSRCHDADLGRKECLKKHADSIRVLLIGSVGFGRGHTCRNHLFQQGDGCDGGKPFFLGELNEFLHVLPV
jgi:hypothetical protein